VGPAVFEKGRGRPALTPVLCRSAGVQAKIPVSTHWVGARSADRWFAIIAFLIFAPGRSSPEVILTVSTLAKIQKKPGV
jgi:hypothetical protein